MVAPVAPYGARGVLWCHGEADAAEGASYRGLLRTLVRDWRRQWGEELPFVWSQMGNFRPPSARPSAGTDLGPELREAQALALAEPGTAMAVGLGADGPELGRRLALAARALAYGEKVVCKGPAYRSMTAQGARVQLTFDHARGGLAAKDSPDGSLRQFFVAGTDRVWHPAAARIDGSCVVVACDDVKAPVAVRYAWLDDPAGCNLYSKEGLPAEPFRTDDWPLLSRPE
jgi:sialate O-acetylesterase